MTVATKKIFFDRHHAKLAAETKSEHSTEVLARLESKGALEAPDVSRPDLRINKARRPPAVERIQQLLRRNPCHVLPRFPGHARRMRACQHIVELQQRVIGRRRLLGPHVKARARDAL